MFLGQLNEWLTLKVQGIIRGSHVVSCPMNFNLLCDAYKQGSVLKLLKKDHFVFLAVWVISPSFWVG